MKKAHINLDKDIENFNSYAANGVFSYNCYVALFQMHFHYYQIIFCMPYFDGFDYEQIQNF